MWQSVFSEYDRKDVKNQTVETAFLDAWTV